MNKLNYSIEDTNQIFQEEKRIDREDYSPFTNFVRDTREILGNISDKIDELKEDSQSSEEYYEGLDQYEVELSKMNDKLSDIYDEVQDSIDGVLVKIKDEKEEEEVNEEERDKDDE